MQAEAQAATADAKKEGAAQAALPVADRRRARTT